MKYTITLIALLITSFSYGQRIPGVPLETTKVINAGGAGTSETRVQYLIDSTLATMDLTHYTKTQVDSISLQLRSEIGAAGGGDMLTSVYDPTGINGSAFDYNNFINKPILFTKTNADGLYYPLSGNPSNFLTTVPAQTFASLLTKPTTVAGYGITDFNSLGDTRWQTKLSLAGTGTRMVVANSTGIISTQAIPTVPSFGRTVGTMVDGKEFIDSLSALSARIGSGGTVQKWDSIGATTPLHVAFNTVDSSQTLFIDTASASKEGIVLSSKWTEWTNKLDKTTADGLYKPKNYNPIDDVTASSNTTYSSSNIQGQINTKQNVLVSGTSLKTINGQSLLGTGDLTVTGGGGATISDSLQTYTSGSSVTVTNGVNVLLIDPTALQSAITVTLPAIPSARNDIEIYFGGTITAGSEVVTTITIVGNSGQTLFEALVPDTMSSGEYLSYKWIPSLNRWYAKR